MAHQAGFDTSVVGQDNDHVEGGLVMPPPITAAQYEALVQMLQNVPASSSGDTTVLTVDVPPAHAEHTG
ncbi:UNVERIFIED_CONTAM: hypothetical protein ITH36_25175, partial [Salmonella enterica subsp. enterica serovar Weltevreden]